MIKRLVLPALAAGVAFATPAQAVVINAGTSGLLFGAFDQSTQGTLLQSVNVPGTALTFSATMRSAVYRNTSGTLDFYYQVARTGAGAIADQMVDAFTAADFTGYSVDGFSFAMDPDGAGQFTAAMNPPSSTTTTGRNPNGSVLQTDFGTNGLSNTEISATYVFRTNAVTYGIGTFGVIDGSSFSGVAFAPTSAVPETSTWAMMIGGFGLIGGVMRRRRTTARVAIA